MANSSENFQNCDRANSTSETNTLTNHSAYTRENQQILQQICRNSSQLPTEFGTVDLMSNGQLVDLSRISRISQNKDEMNNSSLQRLLNPIGSVEDIRIPENSHHYHRHQEKGSSGKASEHLPSDYKETDQRETVTDKNGKTHERTTSFHAQSDKQSWSMDGTVAYRKDDCGQDKVDTLTIKMNTGSQYTFKYNEKTHKYDEYDDKADPKHTKPINSFDDIKMVNGSPAIKMSDGTFANMFDSTAESRTGMNGPLARNDSTGLVQRKYDQNDDVALKYSYDKHKNLTDATITDANGQKLGELKAECDSSGKPKRDSNGNIIYDLLGKAGKPVIGKDGKPVTLTNVSVDQTDGTLKGIDMAAIKQQL